MLVQEGGKAVSIAHFSKVLILPFFKQRPTLVSIFTNQKKLEEYCHVYVKKAKSENSVKLLFKYKALIEAVHTLSSPAKLIAWECTQCLIIQPPGSEVH